MMTTISFRDLVKQYKYTLGAMLLITSAFTGLSLAIPNLTGQIINSVENQMQDWRLMWLIGIVVLLTLITETVQVILSAVFRERVGFDLRKRLMSKITTQNYSNVNNIGIGQIITLFGSDVTNVKDIMAGELLLSIKAIMLFVGALILLFVTNWKLGLIAFVSLPVIVGAFIYIFSKISTLFGEAQQIQTDLNNSISQNIYGSNLVRVQNAEDWEINKFNYQTGKSRDNSFGIINAFSSLIPVINTVVNWTTFGIIYFGALSYIAGDILLGDINAYITYYALLSAPIFIIGFNSQGIARLGVSLKRINELLVSEEMKPTGTITKPITKGIALNNISLEYGGKQVLKDISATFKAGSNTAILGPTGAGKSLLINIITGMILPTQGSVTIDDVSLNEWKSDYIKDKITTVYQESLIFSGDLRQNIILNREVDEEALAKAVETATLTELLETKGHISELGGNLSGGQKQRLTLARALYGNPQFLVLDDFTARVDSKTELTIRERLRANYPNTSIIAVSQTIETIKDYDQIILVMEGELLMTGTHEELLKNSPEYNQILTSQQILD